MKPASQTHDAEQPSPESHCSLPPLEYACPSPQMATWQLPKVFPVAARRGSLQELAMTSIRGLRAKPSLNFLCLSGSLRRQMAIGEGFCVDRAVQNTREELDFVPAPVESEHELVRVALKMLRADPVESSA
jgi:hypothetical protein